MLKEFFQYLEKWRSYDFFNLTHTKSKIRAACSVCDVTALEVSGATRGARGCPAAAYEMDIMHTNALWPAISNEAFVFRALSR